MIDPKQPTNRIKTRAVVDVTVTIELPDTWGADCALDQVFRQAAKGAVDAMQTLATSDKACGAWVSKIEAVKVRAVLAERDQ